MGRRFCWGLWEFSRGVLQGLLKLWHIPGEGRPGAFLARHCCDGQVLSTGPGRAVVQARGGQQRVILDDVEMSSNAEPDFLLQLDDAMNRWAAFEPRLAHVVECRFSGGLTRKETAEALGITVRTVQRDWIKARVLLRRAFES